MDVIREIEIVLRKVFENNTLLITESTVAADIHGWDSLIHMTVINELEEHFKLQFSFDEVSNFNTIGDIRDCIKRKA